MTYADVLTALREDRPYRKSMPIDDSLAAIVAMLQPSENDHIYKLLTGHIAEIDTARAIAQQDAADKYQKITLSA